MQRIFFIILSAFLVFVLAGVQPVSAANEIFEAKVTASSEVKEQDGLRTELVTVEILNGENKGMVQDIEVPLYNPGTRELKAGDHIKVSKVTVGQETYFQFYDFGRSNSYLFLLVPFAILLLTIAGWKGIKTLIPSILLLVMLLVSVLPNFMTKFNGLVSALVAVSIITFITAFIRLKHKGIAIIVCLSVIFCLLLAFFVFSVFARLLYIDPFLGSFLTDSAGSSTKVFDITLLSILFIPLGGVINASIQIAKQLDETFAHRTDLSLAEVLRDGFRISQKIASGELNNLVITILGVSLAGIYFIKTTYSGVPFWDNGWFALQIIIVLCSGMAILLIAPITSVVTTGVIGLPKFRGKTGSQKKLEMK